MISTVIYSYFYSLSRIFYPKMIIAQATGFKDFALKS